MSIDDLSWGLFTLTFLRACGRIGNILKVFPGIVAICNMACAFVATNPCLSPDPASVPEFGILSALLVSPSCLDRILELSSELPLHGYLSQSRLRYCKYLMFLGSKSPYQEKYITREHEIHHSKNKYGTNSFWKFYRELFFHIDSCYPKVLSLAI